MRAWSTTLPILLSLALVGGCAPKDKRNLTGSGSTFVDPIMTRWISQYERVESYRVEYKARGSSRGITDLLDKKVDFACSDGPLDDKELASLKSKGDEVLHIPLILNAVVAVYNLDELKESLRVSGQVLGDIFLGKITKWNDPALRELNPGVALPDKAIAVVHRADGSGTTYIWTDYLAKTNPEWKQRVGTDRTVKWPVGAGENGNDGVAAKVGSTPGSIGYVDLADAYRKSLTFALVKNREQQFVRATLESVLKAADNGLKTIPEDLRFSLTDAPGQGAYPISGTTWAIVYLDQTKNPRNHRLVEFLTWIVGDGQLLAQELVYARLPEALAVKSKESIARILK